MNTEHYSEDFIKFMEKNKDKVKNLTGMEQRLLMFLIDNKLGSFEKIVSFYRELTK